LQCRATSKRPPLASNSRLQFKPLALLRAGIAASVWASAFGYQWWTSGRYIESTDDAYIGGNITAISPHVAGFVTEILVGDNQHVEAGQLLMRLDSRDLQAVMNHAGAVLQQHKFALTGLRAKSVLQQSMVRQAAADLDAKTAQSDFAKVDSGRYRSLVASSSGSRQDAERAIALAQQARSAVASSQAALDGAKQQLIVLEAQIVEAEAFVAQAEADRIFSTRWIFTASAAGFTLASMRCGLAWNIDSMILFRALQGLLGASMIPTFSRRLFITFRDLAAFTLRRSWGPSRRLRRHWAL
jgi:multidrug resistance efflux pump